VPVSRLDEITRRAFLRRSSELAVMGGATSFAMSMSAVANAASTEDYRALVCVFLNGGSDHANTLIPYDSPNYALYSTIRGGGPGETAGGIARARADLANSVLLPSGQQQLTDNQILAIAPEMPRLKALFDSGQMAPLLNVGPLVVPLTRQQYQSQDRSSFPVPPRLFSHNDQQSVWQSLSPEGSTIGWGGRLGDIAQTSNSNVLFTCISATGNAVFLSGDRTLQYQISTNGAIAVSAVKNPAFGSSAVSTALRGLMTRSGGHLFESEYNAVSRRSIEAEAVVAQALSAVSLRTSFSPPAGTPANSLASQLGIVARVIAARQALGTRRQVFFVSMGGFDHHDNLIAGQATLHGRIDFALDAFYRATVEMGIADKVTAFTASDFGRTLASNGDGSDHGWGAHHFVVGGAVKGGRFYGTAPSISVTSNDQVGQGRLLPTTSVDQYAGTLAQWFGVSPSDISTVFPNIGRFATRDLGFL
jgi:uncharacterized protein (DUF1501 family)